MQNIQLKAEYIVDIFYKTMIITLLLKYRQNAIIIVTTVTVTAVTITRNYTYNQ